MAKPGIYEAIVRTLKRLPPESGDYQAKVEAVKQKIVDKSAIALATTYATLRRGSGPPLSEDESGLLIQRLGKDGIKSLASKCEVLVKAHEQLLSDSQRMEAEGWGQFGVKKNALRLPTGETVRIHEEPAAKVVDKERFRLWCIANGYGQQLQLWPSTTQALVKERLLAGEAEPDGTEAYSYVEVQFVKEPKQS